MVDKQQNNPLYGLELEVLLTELVEFYGWDILAVELRFDCFTNNPGIKESVEFLSSTKWAREKLEAFYLYRFKGMPRPHNEQYQLSPRERSFAAGVVPCEPVSLTAKDGKPGVSAKGKYKFEPYHKSNCDRGYCSPKRKASKKPD